MTDKIYLRMKKDESGNVSIVDQDDREVAGLTSVKFKAGVDDINHIKAGFFEGRANGDVSKSGGK